ncbi:hypothetical protein [Aeromonas sp. MrichA-1]|uniref:hypothetical protein n=1 Tax=Aeromonas sp. MrichA-1 TaxID=2823362 RepID=UPI001B3418B7|nr:hypothetical protein [Aeromonas sp. MrichA-1]MBP4081742.1 hypothetical protein [Aeromonas sp. MrichA-1]
MSLLKRFLAFVFVPKKTRQLMKEIEINEAKDKFLSDLCLEKERQNLKREKLERMMAKGQRVLSPKSNGGVRNLGGWKEVDDQDRSRGKSNRDDYTPASFLFGGDVGSGGDGGCGGGDGGGSCGGGGGGD